MVVGGGGIGMLVFALIIALLGGDPTILLDSAAPVGGGGGQRPYSAATESFPAEEEALADLAYYVLADTEDAWNSIFPQEFGGNYREPELVFFSGSVQSACGFNQAAVGPFYCPADQQVYLDLDFFLRLQNQINAPGDFAQAYVIAHEVGHHVQNLLGISDQVRAAQRRTDQTQANQLLVRLELQADCLAGVWASDIESRGNIILEEGDIEEGINAAGQVGDDRLQQSQRGYVNPDSFTHGTAAQRIEWFQRGLQSGDVDQCDTFS